MFYAPYPWGRSGIPPAADIDPGRVRYQPFFDINGDGIINTSDNLQFRSRFNKSLTWRV